jgi:hypothetical protein
MAGKPTSKCYARRILGAAISLTLVVILTVGVNPALADTHPFQFSFGSLANPNGIAVDESSGDVYVADLGSSTVSQSVSKFDPAGNLIESWGTKGVLDGSATSAGPFAFPATEAGTPAAIAVDNSTSPSDGSRGDLYVMDAGHNVIDKFNANGETLTPITGPLAGELLGLGVDADGNVRVDVNAGQSFGIPAIDVFDNSAANHFVALLQDTVNSDQAKIKSSVAHGFAAGSPAGNDYLLFSCGCVEKAGPHAEELGRVDGGSEAVAAAVDRTTGHLYIDDQSSITEWDTGAMNATTFEANEETSSGTLVSSFGSLQLTASPGQKGGIAVDGGRGRIYVSNPFDGKVYVFASTAPAATAGAAANVTRTSAMLQGTVNPGGALVTSCEFEYGTTPALGVSGSTNNYGQSVPCEQAAQVGSGTGPVEVSADVSGLQPGALYHFRLAVGNASGASSSAGLFPTLSAGFGVKSLEVAFLNEDGTPDTQAGSHPFEMVYDMVMNTQIVPRAAGADLRWMTLPDGNLKDVISHFPPGFVGDPNAPIKQCTLPELKNPAHPLLDECPAEAKIGVLDAETVKHGSPNHTEENVFSVTPPPGVAFQLGAHLLAPIVFINVGVPAGGDSGATATVEGAPATEPVLSSRFVIFGGRPPGSTKPLLTLPTACNGPLTSTVTADSYQNPGHFSEPVSSVTRNAAGTPGGMKGCAQLLFPPTIETKPDVSDASSASGLKVGVHVSQKAALNPTGLAESSLRDTTVALPAGVAVNPAGADGLEGCSEGLVGFTGFSEFNPGFEPGDRTATFTSTLLSETVPGESFCPDSSKIGTAKLKTPLLGHELEGSVYLASQNQNPFGSLVAMYMAIEDPVSGTLVKIPFEVRLCETAGEVIKGVSCQVPGQIITTAHNTPQLPFEDLELHFFGGERAPLSTPAHCGTYTTQAVFTPWSGNAPEHTTATFEIEHGPNGGPCPGATLPFAPSLDSLMPDPKAGAFSPLTTTISRSDGQQDMQSVVLHYPPGLSGLLTGVKLCPEAQANEGMCGPESEIGETTVSAGVGSAPVSVKGGKVYLTEKYAGAPFGLSIVNPVKAGPFDLEHDTSKPGVYTPACDCVVVRAKIAVDPTTAALTITTDSSGRHAIPSFIDGVPVQIKAVNVTINRPGFTFNPTNCSSLAVTGAISSDQGASVPVFDHFEVTNCAKLKFAPKFAVSTAGRTSKANGASLTAKVVEPAGAMGTQANISKVKVELPKQLPSRLTTLQKACTSAQFDANPAGCPAASFIGHAVVHTPLLPVPLQGPAIFVSHGGEAFPSLVIVLQGYGVTVDLVGTTFISKAGITSTTFKTVPDVPFNTFELTLPQGKFSALASNLPASAHGSFCGQRLVMPTEFVAQNGAVIHRSTLLSASGCAKAKTRAQKLKAALKACHKKHNKAKRKSCEKQARKKYGPLKKKSRGKRKR